jgi:hypothetical protein
MDISLKTGRSSTVLFPLTLTQSKKKNMNSYGIQRIKRAQISPYTKIVWIRGSEHSGF